MPALAFNRAELELFGTVAGSPVGVLGVGDGLATLALAAMGGRVWAVDAASSILDLLMVRVQRIGVDIQYFQAELTDLSEIRDGTFRLVYSAQVASTLADLGRYYAEVYRLLQPGGRLVVNEYHPFRRIWLQEPGSPRVRHSYFERRRERAELDEPSPVNPGTSFARYESHWTVSDHFHHLSRAGFRVGTLEEVGDTKQKWELPNLRGLPEQLVIGADRPE